MKESAGKKCKICQMLHFISMPVMFAECSQFFLKNMNTNSHYLNRIGRWWNAVKKRSKLSLIQYFISGTITEFFNSIHIQRYIFICSFSASQTGSQITNLVSNVPIYKYLHLLYNMSRSLFYFCTIAHIKIGGF